MLWYILVIYLVIGVMVTAPLLYAGAAERYSEIAEENLGDNGVMFALGLGALLNVIIWPYWVGYMIYQMHFVND